MPVRHCFVAGAVIIISRQVFYFELKEVPVCKIYEGGWKRDFNANRMKS